MTKRKVINDIVMSWLLFIGLIVIITVEQGLESPWNRITNGLWLIDAIALIFFTSRGFSRLYKYLRENKSP